MKAAEGLLEMSSGYQGREAMTHLERQLKHYAPEAPFEYEFLQETFDAMYRTEHRLSQIFTSFALLALFIASELAIQVREIDVGRNEARVERSRGDERSLGLLDLADCALE